MIEELISPSADTLVLDRDGNTPRTQMVLERADEEANRLHYDEVGTEHILLAILSQGDCAAARLLNTMGVNIQKLYVDILCGFYIVTIGAYLFFESVVINYRPVLINGCLEASYPSSTTLLVMCVMPTAVMQFNNRIKNKLLRNIVVAMLVGFIAFMVIGRLISGVHWLTDIVGGALLSSGLVLMYRAIIDLELS